MNFLEHILQPENILLAAAITFAFLSPQQSVRRRMMGFKVSGDVLFGIYFIIMNGVSGGLACFIAACGSFIQLMTPEHKLDQTIRIRILLAIMLSVAAAVVSVENVNDLLPILAIIYCRFVEVQKNPQNIRLGFFFSIFPWAAYNIENGFYGALLCNIIILTSLTIALIRHRDLKIPKETV